MPETEKPVVNEHVLEIRYKPNPKILDLRGTWAEQVSLHMDLPHWRIVENRIDVFTEGESIHAFIGFRNGGMTALDTPTKNFFPDQATKLLRFLFSLDAFGDPLFVERLGVRSKFCTPFSGEFDELKERYSTRYLSLTEKARQAIGEKVKLIDIGGPLNFADHLGNFNTMSGPMPREQFSGFFKRKEGFPKVGLFLDIDYWLRPNESIAGKKLIKEIYAFAIAAWERYERIRDLILGD